MDRNDARDAVDIPRRPVRAAAAFSNQAIPRRFARHLLPHHVFGVGVTSEYCTVSAQDHDRAAIVQRDRLVKFLEVFGADASQYCAEKLTVRAADTADEIDSPRTGGTVFVRRAEKGSGVVVGPHMLH